MRTAVFTYDQSLDQDGPSEWAATLNGTRVEIVSEEPPEGYIVRGIEVEEGDGLAYTSELTDWEED